MNLKIISKYDENDEKYYFAENEEGSVLFAESNFSSRPPSSPGRSWQFASMKEIEKAVDAYKKFLEREEKKKIEKTLEI